MFYENFCVQMRYAGCLQYSKLTRDHFRYQSHTQGSARSWVMAGIGYGKFASPKYTIDKGSSGWLKQV